MLTYEQIQGSRAVKSDPTVVTLHKLEMILSNSRYQLQKINEYYIIRDSINFNIVVKTINLTNCINSAYKAIQE